MRTFRVLFSIPPKCLEPYYYQFSQIDLKLLMQVKDLDELFTKIATFCKNGGWNVKYIEELR